MDSGLSASDIALLGEGNGMGANSIIWILALLILFSGGFNGGWNRGGEQYATNQEVQTGFYQQDTSAMLRGISNGLADGFYAMNNTIKDGNAAINGNINTEARGLQTQIADLKYDMATMNANTLATVHAEAEQTRNMIQTNKIEELQNKVNNLELQQNLCGVVRYPNAMTYNAGGSPFCGGCCNAI